MTKREAFVTMMTVLGESFNRPLTSGAIEGYWMACEEMSEEDMRLATKLAMKACKFMPTASELLGFVRQAERDADKLQARIASNRWLENKERELKAIADARPSAEQLADLRKPMKALVASLVEEKTEPKETAAKIAERENEARRKIAEDLAIWQARNPS